MKLHKLFSLLIFTLMIASCSSIKIYTDYDSNIDFKKYKTFAFYKPGIDKATISSLDKKRILHAIETEMVAQGFTKSSNPDVLISIFTKSREKINVNQTNFGFGYGFGWGWNPWIGNGLNSNINISRNTEGTLFIDFIDPEKKELVWQGIGSGALRTQNRDKKVARINQFVKKIIAEFPSETTKK